MRSFSVYALFNILKVIKMDSVNRKYTRKMRSAYRICEKTSRDDMIEGPRYRWVNNEL